MKQYKARLVMTVELEFDLKAHGSQMAEDLVTLHETKIHNLHWLAEQAHPNITSINETLNMSRIYVREKNSGIKLG